MITEGQCLCGGVRFSVRGPLAPIQICHCAQCRRAQGGPFATNLPVARGQFDLLAGADLLTSYSATPGKQRVFCSRCGAPVYSTRDAKPGILRVRAGLLSASAALSAAGLAFHQQVSSACDWWPITVTGHEALDQFEGAPPP